MEKLFCKNCGSEIEIVYGQKTTVCDFCDMEQTVPTPDDPQKLELFVKANEYRSACRFDVAKKQYESIITQYPDDNEAYWCKILCEYGIEYVDDDLTEKKLPTCHRTVTESIFDNSEYKLIMSRATAEEKAIYEAEAKEIDRIQKEILAKADKEEPYDVFICYKETELNSGKRTTDAQYATKIYSYLTEHGYKVFFSRITLKNKLGSEYEPVIYSALKSAKVMLHVTTSIDHTNAPWVRNEWSRYLEFMNDDVTKTALPCIAQMGPYELPDELARFQVADVTDLDFYENLLLQINKKFGRYVQPQTQEPVAVSPIRNEQNGTISADNATDRQVQNYLERIEIFFEDKDWKKADEYAERILDVSPKCAKAYLYKAFCEYKVTSIEELAKQQGFTQNSNFKKAIRFGDPQFSASLSSLKEPTPTPTPAPVPQKPTTTLKVGDTYKFGKYYQSNDTEKEPIEWQVLATEGNRALLISKYALDCKPYNKERKEVTWETCSIRKWLNNDFISTAFTTTEKEKIPTVAVSADKNPSYSTNPGNSTLDKVFLLSILEANKYLSSNTERQCKPTSYAKKNGAYVNKDNGNSSWWLRSPGYNQYFAAGVSVGGVVRHRGKDNYVYFADSAVRPALWVELDVSEQTTPESVLTPVQTTTPTPTPAPVPQKPTITLKVGDIYKFGKYCQSNGSTKEPIEWQVLAKEGNKALLISKYALDCKRYNETSKDVTWETCSLRKWLNSDFINSAFGDAEKAIIPTVTVSADKNPYYNTNPGNATQDKVFLLSIPEANKYFSNSTARQCKPTVYAKKNGAYVYEDNGNSPWWLRSPGYGQDFVSHVSNDGVVIIGGSSVTSDLIAVRPALWVNLES
ncbi:MAG: toll/interleukin-1 receptor domain-containing protein [Clostridia bacterium]|nr:toll/interleukin-1 receptor domain-containing protein [Clostridia bacterium]